MRYNIFSTVADKASQDVRNFVEMKIAAAKLSVVEGLSTVSGNAVRILIFIFLVSMALMAFFAAAIIALGNLLDSYVWGALIVGGVCLIIGVIVFLLRKAFVNPMVGMFSRMVFSQPPKHEEDYYYDEED